MNRFLRLVVLVGALSSAASGQEDTKQQQARIASAIAAWPVEKGKLWLYSLDPSGGLGYSVNTDKVFHGFTILGKGEITASKDKSTLMQAFARGVRENDGWVAACFNPRHGVRLIIGATTYEFVICFECCSVQCYGFNDDRGFLITSSPQPRFDEFLARLGLKKAPKDG